VADGIRITAPDPNILRVGMAAFIWQSKNAEHHREAFCDAG